MRQIFLIFILLVAPSFAHNTPQGSSFDARMQTVSYNIKDVTRINTRLGFVTTIIFDADEIVEQAISGFEAGWHVVLYKNKLFVNAVPIEQPSFDDQNQDEAVDTAKMNRFEPSPKEWHTNLFVSTNKRNYSMDLNIIPQGTYAHVVQYRYPEQEKLNQDKQKIRDGLAQDKYPRNWNYHFKMGEGSDTIVPDFAYDDGALTYFGFLQGKSFPSVFLLKDGEEQIINYSVEQKGNYKVMVIHKLNDAFVLRYGTQVVGILNKSFGQYFKPHHLTSSASVRREDIHD